MKMFAGVSIVLLCAFCAACTNKQQQAKEFEAKVQSGLDFIDHKAISREYSWWDGDGIISELIPVVDEIAKRRDMDTRKVLDIFRGRKGQWIIYSPDGPPKMASHQ